MGGFKEKFETFRNERRSLNSYLQEESSVCDIERYDELKNLISKQFPKVRDARSAMNDAFLEEFGIPIYEFIKEVDA